MSKEEWRAGMVEGERPGGCAAIALVLYAIALSAVLALAVGGAS